VDAVSDGGTDLGTGEVVWDIASLSSGVSLRRTITVTADNVSRGDIIRLHAELTHNGGQEIDSSSQFAVSVANTTPPISATITATPDPVADGGTLAYSITVTNDSALPANAVSVIFRVPAELSFRYITDAEPDAACGSTTCVSTLEAAWDLGTMAAGATQVITINATVAAGLDNGTLINVPVRVTVTELQDTINLQHTTVIGN